MPAFWKKRGIIFAIYTIAFNRFYYSHQKGNWYSRDKLLMFYDFYTRCLKKNLDINGDIIDSKI